MQLGYTILYVLDEPASLKFYEVTFGLTTRFLHEVTTTASWRRAAKRLRFQLRA